MDPLKEIPDLPGIDTADGLRRVLGKTALYERVLRDFHARFQNEAEEIRAAFLAGDLMTAERLAHSTKGLAATIGALPLHHTAKILEGALHAGGTLPDELFEDFKRELGTVIGGIAVGLRIG